MTKIYEDEMSLYAKVGGWIARPVGPTRFQKGDKTQGYHFGGTTMIGMGKIPGSKRRGRYALDNYEEIWRTPDGIDSITDSSRSLSSESDSVSYTIFKARYGFDK